MLHPQQNIKVVIADDHFFFREGFKLFLNKQKELLVVADAANGKELYFLVERYKPNVVVTDISMPVMDGITATKLLKKNFPQVEVVGLSMHDNPDFIKSMFEAGAKAYLLKDSSIEAIAEAIRVVHQGHYYYSEATSSVLNHVFGKQTIGKQNRVVFSPRELDIINLICEEKTSKEIAAKLGIHERTVEDHRCHIQKKIDAKNMAGIIVYAFKNKIVTLN